ncbi:hypothetical protein Tco_1240410 [Tanacetum coccineum]
MYVENDDGMIHYILQKQCCTNDDSFDLPLIYYVNGHSLHIGRCKFFLITGFKFGSLSFREYRNGDILFRNQLFLEKIGYDVKIIDVLALIEDEKKFSKVEHIWRQLYDAIRNVSLKQLEHLDGLRKTTIIPLVEQGVRNDPETSIMVEKSRIQVGVFRRTVWGLSKKSSATRAAKQKDSEEVHPVLCGRNSQSSGREKGRDATLIDRVHDLEGICERLLRLPKEVKSLRGCIFKLETLIQAITLKRDGVQKKEKLKRFFQKEDLLQDTSEEEPDNKDDTSPENTYSCRRIPLGNQPSEMSLSIYRC